MKIDSPPSLDRHSSQHRAASGCAVRVAEAAQDWGWFAVAAMPSGVCGATFGHDNALEAGGALEESVGIPDAASVDADTIVEAAVTELHAFFAGESLSFDVPVALAGTAFQRAVWQETIAIAYGKLSTYREVAKRIGKPQAYRAVGNALGQNPLPIIVPCHRVIASDGSFGGYTRGLPWKKRLLAFERSLELVPAR